VSDIFVSYARSNAAQAQQVAEALRALGYQVWRDDQLPAHRAYGDVIEERLSAARAVVVIWSDAAVKSQWVRAEANRAREDGKLVQLNFDGVRLPLPFDQIQCADMRGWSGGVSSPGWQKVLASIADLTAVAPTPQPIETSHPPAQLPLPAKPSIAVMPFANLSGDPAQEYFADGMVLEIVEALARSRSIFVIASASSMSFKGKGVSAQDAARQLGVRYVLEGSVRKAGGRIRIGVQLIDGADGAPIWTHRFEETLDDIFDLQDKVALAVAGKIEPTVEQAEIQRAATHPTGNINSHDLYLRALPIFRTHTRAGTLEALDLLNQAIALDAAHAPALALAVSCHRTILIYGWSDDVEAHREQGILLAKRAIKSAAEDAAVLASVANDLSVLEKSVELALPLAERAIAINPGSANVWFNCGWVRFMAGEIEAAIEHFETAMRLDPAGANRPAYLLYLGAAHFFAERFEQAAALLRERNQYSESPGGAAFLAASYGHLGQTGPAREALARYRALTPLPIESLVQTFLDPRQRSMLLGGFAFAEGRHPSGDPAVPQDEESGRCASAGGPG
jgi:adenylate cyclase